MITNADFINRIEQYKDYSTSGYVCIGYGGEGNRELSKYIHDGELHVKENGEMNSGYCGNLDDELYYITRSYATRRGWLKEETKKPSYEELEQMVQSLEKELTSIKEWIRMAKMF